MGFRITCADGGAGNVVLRMEGHLVGPEAARVLLEQIAHATARGDVVVDLRDVAWYDEACLAILEARASGVRLAGGGALLAAFLEQRRKVPPTS